MHMAVHELFLVSSAEAWSRVQNVVQKVRITIIKIYYSPNRGILVTVNCNTKQILVFIIDT